MDVFDTHIHSEGRSVEDLSRMAERGIKMAVTCAFYPIQPLFQETLIDLFRKLTIYEQRRGEKAGMKIHAAVGMHPRCIPPEYSKVIEFMETNEGWVAFGEIGLETGDDREVEVFKEQLKLAKKIDMRCIIHTPRKNKKEITAKTLQILDSLSFPEDLAIVDHVSMETAGEVLKAGYFVGLTVQPGKLTEKDVYEIVSKFGVEKMVLNSDTGFSESDMFATVKAVEHLLESGMDKEEIERVAYKNAKEFFGV
jgi:predicted metal-dependent TIM-barrel fold hydrolase